MDANARIRVPDGLVRLTSFLANAIIATMFISSAMAGFKLATTHKFTTDKFGPGLMTRYQVLRLRNSSRAQSQLLCNALLIRYGLLKWVAGPFFLALGSYELWARRIDDAARARGKSLKASYRPRFRRFHTRWASISQALLTVTLTLLGLSATYLATLGAWMVEDKVSRAGLSFPLSAMNKTVYYGGVVPKDAMDVATINVSSPDSIPNFLLELREKGLIHPANPPISYHALYPGDTLAIPDEMRTTAYYLPRSSFAPLEDHLLQGSRQQMGISGQPPLPNANFTARGVRFGDAVYPDSNTLGIGINMTSYERFMGDGMPGLPRDFMMGAMVGEVYGNPINVQCLDITDEYRLSTNQTLVDDKVPTTHYNFNKKQAVFNGEDGYHFSVPSASASGPLIFSTLSFSGKNPLSFSFRGGEYDKYGDFHEGQEEHVVFTDVPLQTFFIIPESHRTSSAGQQPLTSTVLKCIYIPSELGITFGAMSDRLERTSESPLANEDNPRMGPLIFPKTDYFKDMSPLPVRCMNPIYALPAIRAVHELLTNPNPFAEGKHNSTAAGGVLREVLKEYYQRNPPTPGYGRWETRNARFLRENVIQPVLSSTASAYFSLLRQRIEIANVWVPMELSAPTTNMGAGIDMEDFTGRVSMPQDAMGPAVGGDILVRAIRFWILKVGGAAPYGFSYVGIVVLFWMGMKAGMKAYRTAVFGRGEWFFGRWWESDSTTVAPGGEKKKDSEVEVEKGAVTGNMNTLEPLLENRQSMERVEEEE